ncbi:MAG: hypothetical protein K5888_12310 [Lachnospiraceae bacterium]|nr:hypothetical protein [Lachnospiraceae bacterium]
MLEKLNDEKVWEEFYDNRRISGHLSSDELKGLRTYIDEKRYGKIAEKILRGTYEFTVPNVSYISKVGSDKKRLVYVFPEDEVWILKHLAILLHKYDSKLSPACYSFRSDLSVKNAIRRVLNSRGLDKKFVLKTDIHDYFNSIPQERLCEKLSEFIDDDDMLRDMLIRLLSADIALSPDKQTLIRGNRGAMAGIPIAPFFANIYLKDLDDHFSKKGCMYLRYSDDIIIFSDDMNELLDLKTELDEHIREKGLTINKKKTSISKPGEGWEFLGFRYCNGVIDLSENTKRKIKAKIKRKAHALYRWRNKKGTTFEQTAFVMIRIFNYKFYDMAQTGDFSWAKWFFPVINTDEGLREIDRYLIRYIRFLYKGRHYKGNYRITYDDIKALGFRSLVNEFYGMRRKR